MPFANYRDFAECVRKNADKRDPQAYCAAIERAVKEHKRLRKRRVRVPVRRMEDIERGPI